MRNWLVIAAVLALVAGGGLLWARRTQARLAYLLRPQTVPLAGSLLTPDGSLALHLESLTLTATELQILGRVEQRQHPEYDLRSLRLRLVNESHRESWEREQPLWARAGTAPVKESWVWGDDGRYRRRWHFPYRRLNAHPGDELALLLSGFSLVQKLEESRTVAVADLAPERLPLAVPAGAAGAYVVQRVEWQGERGGTTITAEHQPAPDLRQAVAAGLRVHFGLTWITDDQGRRYIAAGGTDRSAEGHAWVERTTFQPIDPAAVRELTLHFYQVGLDWDAAGPETPHLRFRLPERE